MILANGISILPTIFPDKTSQVWHIDSSILTAVDVKITWEFEHESELLWLVQLVYLIHHTGRNNTIKLYIPYLPYGRQDKDISNESTFSLYVFADIINNLDLDAVYTIDVHNYDMFEAYFYNAHNIIPVTYIDNTIKSSNPDLIGFPDKGAVERYSFMTLPSVIGDKERDPATGYLVYKGISNDVDLNGKSVLIVDDICDGGMTFILFSKLLYEKGASEVNLYTTHGIYSKGIDCLKKAGIKHIYNRNGEVR